MLSIAKMTVAAAENYYQKNKDELYYSKSPEERGIWKGTLTKYFDLNRDEVVEASEFKRLLRCQHPKTFKNLGLKKQEIAGYDLTFSAPKSVSIIHEIGDEKIRSLINDAHAKAVSRAREFIESEYAAYQTRNREKRGSQKTNEILAAEFLHDTSRNLDPDLHTHLFIHNFVIDEKQKFRSFDARNLFKNEYFLGMLYRSELAHNLQNLGFELRITNQSQGFFELENVSDEAIIAFSSRAAEIENARDEMKKKLKRELTKAEYDLAKTSTRSSKKKIDRDEIRAKNVEKASKLLKIDTKQNKSKIHSLNVEDAIKIAIEIQIQTESVFKKEELMRNILKIGLANNRAFTLNEVEKSIEDNKDLVRLDDERLFSTEEMVEKEKAIFQDAKISHYNALCSNPMLSDALTAGQRHAADAILSNKNLMIVCQGDAGTGKTTLLREVKKNSQKELLGLAYTAKAASEIEEASGIKSMTLHSFLASAKKQKDAVLIVDEASMISTRQLFDLIAIAKENNNQIVLVGDQKQFKAIGQGDIFSRLQLSKDIKTVEMTQSLRAKTEEMKEIYELAKNRKFDLLFSKMAQNQMITQIPNATAIDKIVKDYDADTLVISSNNTARTELNAAIRQSLNLPKGQMFDVKENTTPQNIDRYFSQSYKIGDIVRCLSPIQGLKNGACAKIIGIDHESNTLILENNAKINLLKKADKIETYREKQIELSTGDKIIFTKNDQKLKVKNGEVATIKSIDADKIIVTKGEKELKIDTKIYDNIDFGYAITDYKSQGQTAKKVAILADPKMATSNSLYVQITRAQNEIKIYTNDIQKFQDNAQKQQIKLNATDYIHSNLEEQNGRFREIARNAERTLAEKFKHFARNFAIAIDATRRKQRTEFRRDIALYRLENSKNRSIADTVRSILRPQHNNIFDPEANPNVLEKIGMLGGLLDKLIPRNSHQQQNTHSQEHKTNQHNRGL